MPAPYHAILARIPEEDRNLAFLNMNRALNMVGGMRPSDAARDELRTYERQGAAEYRRQFHAAREVSAC